MGRINSSDIPAGGHYSLPPCCGRHGAVDSSNSFPSNPGVPYRSAELVAYFRDYQRLVDYWRNVLPTDRFIEVDYEELTREPEPIIRRIIAACGLAWNDACLRPESNPRAVKPPASGRRGSQSTAPPSRAGDGTNPGWGRCARWSTLYKVRCRQPWPPPYFRKSCRIMGPAVFSRQISSSKGVIA